VAVAVAVWIVALAIEAPACRQAGIPALWLMPVEYERKARPQATPKTSEPEFFEFTEWPEFG
jgi:hypothetical protein